MKKNAKRIISICLACVMVLTLLVPVFAEGNQKTHHIVINKEKHVQVIFTNNSSEWVNDGDQVTFYVKPDEGYSTVRLIVSVDGEDDALEPDVHGEYTIEDIQSDIILNVFFSQDNKTSGFMSSLILLFRNLFNWIKSIFSGLFGKK